MLGNQGSGHNLHAEFTISGLPWVTSSFARSGNVTEINFEKITRDITVSCIGPTTGSSLRIGFTYNDIVTSNYLVVKPGEDLTIPIRVRDLFLLGDTAGTTYSLCAGLTTVDVKQMQRLSASFDITPITLYRNNLLAWFDPAQEITTVSGSVSALGNAASTATTYDLTTAASTNRPAYSASDSTGNNKPSMTFDGSNDILQNLSACPYAGRTQITDFLVLKFNRVTGSAQSPVQGGDATQSRLLIYHQSPYYLNSYQTPSIYWWINYDSTDTVILERVYEGDAALAGNRMKHFVNGGIQQQLSVGVVPTVMGAATQYLMGAYTTGAAAPFDGKIFEQIIVDTANESKRVACRKYLASKYNIIVDPRTPSQIFGTALLSWHRADMGITTVSGNVSAWADQSGNGYDYIQSSVASRPVYVSSDSGINGQACMQFDGSNDYLETTIEMPIGVCTIYMVAKNRRIASNEIHFVQGNIDVLTDRGIALATEPGFIGASRYIVSARNGSSYSLKYKPYSLSWMQSEIRFAETHVLTEYSMYSFGNASQLALNNDQGTSTTTKKMYLGGNGVSLSYAQQDVAEFIIINRLITPAERIEMVTYFRDRYNL